MRIAWGDMKTLVKLGQARSRTGLQGSVPAGRSCDVNASQATAWMVLADSGSPCTRNEPSTNSRSSALASSRCAAMSRALATTASAAVWV